MQVLHGVLYGGKIQHLVIDHQGIPYAHNGIQLSVGLAFQLFEHQAVGCLQLLLHRAQHIGHEANQRRGRQHKHKKEGQQKCSVYLLAHTPAKFLHFSCLQPVTSRYTIYHKQDVYAKAARCRRRFDGV